MARYGLILFCLILGVQLMVPLISGTFCLGGDPVACLINPCPREDTPCSHNTLTLCCSDYYCGGCRACYYENYANVSRSHADCPYYLYRALACKNTVCGTGPLVTFIDDF